MPITIEVIYQEKVTKMLDQVRTPRSRLQLRFWSARINLLLHCVRDCL